MAHRLFFSDRKKKVAVMVSKQGHCLLDLLYRWRIGEMPMEPVAILSNHPREAIEHTHLGHGPGVYHVAPTPPHHHLVCDVCGATVDVPARDLEAAVAAATDSAQITAGASSGAVCAAAAGSLGGSGRVGAVWAAVGAGLGAGFHYSFGREETQRWAEWGANLIIHSSDFFLLREKLTDDLRYLRAHLGEDPS